MITRLLIRNYALIRELDIEWERGFTTITGETGAGKSILLGALSLILGQRADPSVLNNKEQKCVVECSFDITKCDLSSFFSYHDLDYESITILRREITPAGKSRSFINDTPVNLSLLKELSRRLINIHSQHQTSLVENQEFQLSFLDHLVHQEEVVVDYRKRYAAYQALCLKCDELEQEKDKAKIDFDYYQFQHGQLLAAELKLNEQVNLESELKRLTNSESIKQTLFETTELLSTDENRAAVLQLRLAFEKIKSQKLYSNEIEVWSDRLESVIFEIEDIVAEVDLFAQTVEFNKERIEEIENRLDVIFSLQHKHRVGSVEELLQLQHDFERKIQSVASFDEELSQLKSKISSEICELMNLAQSISKKRGVAAQKLEKAALSIFPQLGLKEAQLKVKICEESELNSTGIDHVLLLFTANVGNEPREISKVASGGELSRLMLLLKYLWSQTRALPTVVFDEIDAGISGQIAGKVGQLLKRMGDDCQVINITHLPQVAAQGDNHYFVYKKKVDGKTTSSIRKLLNEQRVEVLAKMLSNQNVTEAAVEHARHLLHL